MTTITAIVGVLVALIGAFFLGKGVRTPPTPDIPKRKKPTSEIKHEAETQQVDAAIAAADDHGVDPDVVADGLDWLLADDDL